MTGSAFSFFHGLNHVAYIINNRYRNLLSTHYLVIEFEFNWLFRVCSSRNSFWRFLKVFCVITIGGAVFDEMFCWLASMASVSWRRLGKLSRRYICSRRSIYWRFLGNLSRIKFIKSHNLLIIRIRITFNYLSHSINNSLSISYILSMIKHLSFIEV